MTTDMLRSSFQFVTDAIATAVSHCDAERRFLFVNRAYVERFGLTPDQVVGRTVQEVLGEEAYQSIRPYIDRVLAGECLSYEAEINYSGLGRRYMHCAYTPEIDARGEVVGWVAAVTDMTDRHRLEQALRDSEERYRALAETLRASESRFRQLYHANAAGLVLADFEGRIYEANDEFLRIIGYSREDLETGHIDWKQLTPPEHLSRDFEAMDQLQREGRHTPFEKDFIRKDGSRVQVLVSVALLGGEPPVALGTAVDLTPLKRAEQALRESEEHLRLALQGSPVVLFQLDLDLRYTWIHNPLLGLSPEQIIGRTGREILPRPEDAAPIEAMERQVIETGEPVRDRDVRIHDSQGRVTWWNLSAVPWRDESGAVAGVRCLAVDITERKRAEQSLQEADRRKDEFLATLAHELRNPLAPIRNAVQILRMQGPPAPELQWPRDVIDRQVQQLTRLVDDLLDVSRITTGKIELRKEEVEISALFDRALETSRPLLEASGHRLTVTFPQGSLSLPVDLARMAQVLSNLLNNAAKYTRAGGHIELSAAREDGHAVIRVRDNGIGIPAEKLSSIFEMFSQVDTSLDRAQGGLGIGLTIAKLLVEMHGGTLEAASEGRDQGSELTLRIPLAPGESAAGPAPAQRDGEPAPRPSLRILVVDDNRDSADSLALLLRLKGDDVRVAHDGPQALAVAREHRPEVILLDIGMPGMSGYEVARRLREMPETRDVAILAMTGWGQDEDRRRSKEAGFDLHLVKPLDPQGLQDLIARFAGQGRQTG